MNRIYQGRVSAVERFNDHKDTAGQTPWIPTTAGEELLHRHHALFQDAVNYYLVALLALAAPANPALGRLREKIAVTGDDFQIWECFRRRGTNRRGLRDSIAPYLTPAQTTPSLDEVFAAVLAGNEADACIRDAAVSMLLQVCDGAGAIQQQGRAYWPKFCDPGSTANFAGDPVMVRRQRHSQLLPRVLHDPATRFDSPELDEFDTYSIATPDSKRPIIAGAKARARLQQAVAAWRGRRSDAAADFDRFTNLIDSLPESYQLPGYVGSSAKGEVQARLFALLLFKHVERSPLTFELLRSATPPPRKTEAGNEAHSEARETPAADPIRLARGERGYVFRAFSSLPCWNPGDSAEPQWKEFDIAAFKYALTALNQIEEKTKERNEEAKKLEARLGYMRSDKPGKFSGASDQDEPPPILTGDPRIGRLRAILASDALRVANALTDGDAAEYGLHPRTIRGFRELRKLWRRQVTAGEVFSPEKQGILRNELREFQTANNETIGSVALFEALLDPENWIAWQEPDAQLASAWSAAGFVTDPNDPLTALVEEKELERRLARLREPVRLTPADAVYSRRQYYFSDVSKFSGGRKARNRHEPGALAFTTEIAICEQGVWKIQRVRISYSAPRLLRDGLRGETESGDLTSARWLQPMMEALVPTPPLLQDLTSCPVSLMPDATVSGERRILLNFPVTLDPNELVRQLGRKASWDGQFCGPKDEPFALRWPTDKWPEGKEPNAWYRRLSAFSVLGVDLGTRDAGAMAHLTVTSDAPGKAVHRFLGEAGGHRWFAHPSSTQLIRLPGEDAKIFVAGNNRPVAEKYGERGRLASETESAEAQMLIRQLGEDPDKLLGHVRSEARRFFPIQNDMLLVALRRAQARLARMQSLSWRVRDEKKLPEARTEIAQLTPDRADLDRADLVVTVDADLRLQRDLVTRALVLIANRVMPLRGRRWEWVPLRNEGRGYRLQQTDPGSDATPRRIAGQRGLSHERMEQIEELRRRCQSLNRALQHEPGQAVRIGPSTRGDELPDPCPTLLRKIENLREQRVDQTAHAILAAALGVRLRAPTKDSGTRNARDIHGEYEWFRDPVDFIVIEDLSRYLSSQDRARRENTRLMQWCHRQLVAKLRQLCETYGLPVLATPAAYSSRFCSRAGAAGFRAVQLSPEDCHEAPWRWTLERLAAHERAEKPLRDHALAEAQNVRELFATLDRINAGRAAAGKPPRTLLAPLAGGPIFVPLSGAPTMQADLNAAINIALRGIAAPDCHDIHHRIRTERKAGALQLRQSSQREKARWGSTPPALKIPEKSTASERMPNLFADRARIGFADQRVTLEGLDLPFATGVALWTAVKRRAWERVAALNHALVERWAQADDDIPM